VHPGHRMSLPEPADPSGRDGGSHAAELPCYFPSQGGEDISINHTTAFSQREHRGGHGVFFCCVEQSGSAGGLHRLAGKVGVPPRPDCTARRAVLAHGHLQVAVTQQVVIPRRFGLWVNTMRIVFLGGDHTFFTADHFSQGPFGLFTGFFLGIAATFARACSTTSSFFGTRNLNIL